MKFLVFTFGYQGRTPEELDVEAQRVNAVIVDVRLAPYSKIPGWSLRELIARFGDRRYVWVRELGNKARHEGGVELASPDAGYARLGKLLAQHGAVILLCACQDLAKCHRRWIAEDFTAGDEDLCHVHHLSKEPDRKQEGLVFA